MACLEVAKFVASDAFKADPLGTLKPALEILSTVPGWIKSYYGMEKETPERGWIIAVWDTFEHNKALVDDKETFQKIFGVFSACVGGDPEMFHTVSSVDPLKALDAPVTSIVYISPKEASDKAEVEQLVAELCSSKLKGAHLFTHGAIMEKGDKGDIFALGGWDSIETHHGATAADESGKSGALIGKITAKASFIIGHVNFKGVRV